MDRRLSERGGRLVPGRRRGQRPRLPFGRPLPGRALRPVRRRSQLRACGGRDVGGHASVRGGRSGRVVAAAGEPTVSGGWGVAGAGGRWGQQRLSAAVVEAVPAGRRRPLRPGGDGLPLPDGSVEVESGGTPAVRRDQHERGGHPIAESRRAVVLAAGDHDGGGVARDGGVADPDVPQGGCKYPKPRWRGCISSGITPAPSGIIRSNRAIYGIARARQRSGSYSWMPPYSPGIGRNSS